MTRRAALQKWGSGFSGLITYIWVRTKTDCHVNKACGENLRAFCFKIGCTFIPAPKSNNYGTRRPNRKPIPHAT